MPQPRQSQRYRTDVVLDFGTSESRTTGMTWDVSNGGMFIRTTRMPQVGQTLLVILRLPGGRQVRLQCEVVRVFHPPEIRRGALPAGFAVAITQGDGYKQFIESLSMTPGLP